MISHLKIFIKCRILRMIQIKQIIFNFVDQYFNSESIKILNKNIIYFTSFFRKLSVKEFSRTWYILTSNFRFLNTLSSMYKHRSLSKWMRKLKAVKKRCSWLKKFRRIDVFFMLIVREYARRFLFFVDKNFFNNLNFSFCNAFVFCAN